VNGSAGVKGVAGSGIGSVGLLAGAAFQNTTGLLVTGNSSVSENESVYFTTGSAGKGECDFDGGPGFNCSSDRNLKADFTQTDARALLAKVAALPEWKYRMKGSLDRAWYVGPTAQDFRAAFGLGANDTTINTANAQGVALTAIKGLNQKLDDAIAARDAEIAALKQQVAALQSLAARVSALENSPPVAVSATYQAARAVEP
jgi:hypothetical protein